MIDSDEAMSLEWTKASASQGYSMCVEVAPYAGGIALRDSKNPHVGAFYYSRAEFAAFVQGCRTGEFDDLL